MTDENDNLTSKKTTRWEYLSSLITLLLHITLCVLLIGASAGVFAIGAITQAWFVLYSTALIASTGWLFGREYVEWKGGK